MILDAADQALHHRMVRAHHREAVERHVLDEGAERILHRVESLEVVEMLGIDIGDDGDVGRQLEEGAVGLVGLDHHPVAGAEPRIGAVGVDDAAVDDGRIEAAGVEQRRHHRGRRGLAVRAGDGDAALQPHQLGQHLGAAHHRQPLRARRREFRIVALDRRGDDDDLGAAEIVGIVADRDRDALVAQPLDVGAVGLVGALHRVAEIDQHLGDAAHADAADADEMDRSDVARQFHAACSDFAMAESDAGQEWPSHDGSIVLKLVRRTDSRHLQHQIGQPVGGIEPADRLRGRRHGGEPLRLRRQARRSRRPAAPGVKSLCTRRIAPPAASSTPALANWS